jgi:hypothetical protein
VENLLALSDPQWKQWGEEKKESAAIDQAWRSNGDRRRTAVAQNASAVRLRHAIMPHLVNGKTTGKTFCQSPKNFSLRRAY